MTSDYQNYHDHRVRAEIVEVIQVTMLIGEGVTGNPCREVFAYYDKDGVLLVHSDKLNKPKPT